MELAQDCTQWQPLVLAVLNVQVYNSNDILELSEGVKENQAAINASDLRLCKLFR
jgi:hypothetical protein